MLVQLPKKDAGAGMAFGAGTADALFGAGSGNLLTKITGWAAGILLALCCSWACCRPARKRKTTARISPKWWNKNSSKCRFPAEFAGEAAHRAAAGQRPVSGYDSHVGDKRRQARDHQRGEVIPMVILRLRRRITEV